MLGGMGPEATAYFFNLIIRGTRARHDQDHIPVVVDSNPKIPDRTAAIMGRGTDPSRALIAGARRLARAGADFVVIPCVSAHAFLPRVESRSPLPFIDLVHETCVHARRAVPHLRKVGLLATTGTLRSEIFTRVFAAAGIEVIVPAATVQRRLMRAIYGRDGIKAGTKTGHPRRLVLAAGRTLIRRGAQAIIAGCTEIPLVLGDEDIPVPLFEPMHIAAEACIRRAGYPVREAPARPPRRTNS